MIVKNADALFEQNFAVQEYLQSIQRKFNHALQEFGEVEPCSGHSLPKLKMAETAAGRIVHAQRVFVYKAIFEFGGFCDC